MAEWLMMKPASNLWFRIDFEVSFSQEDGEPSDFITVYHGNVIAIDDDDEEHRLGKVCMYIVERDRVIDQRRLLFDVMDCLDGDSWDCFVNLFDIETEELKAKVDDDETTVEQNPQGLSLIQQRNRIQTSAKPRRRASSS